MMPTEVCSPLNKARKATPALTPRLLKGANPKHAPIYSGTGPVKLAPGGARDTSNPDPFPITGKIDVSWR
jgi:hypothetical protein